MSVGYRGKTVNLEREVVATQAQAEREAMWGEMPGRIVSFDAEAQTATIQPLYKPRHNGVAVDMPELVDVPVRFQRAGGGGITFPIKAGDRVTLRPMMRSTQGYHTGGDYEATDTRSSALSDMEAFLDGGEPLSEPIPNFDADNMHVRFDDDGLYGIRGSSDGRIKIEGRDGNIYDLLATAIELIASDGLHILTGSSAGLGIHELEHKAELTEIAAKLRAMAL